MEPEKGTFCAIKARNQSNKNLRHMLLGGRIKGKSEKMKKKNKNGEGFARQFEAYNSK